MMIDLHVLLLVSPFSCIIVIYYKKQHGVEVTGIYTKYVIMYLQSRCGGLVWFVCAIRCVCRLEAGEMLDTSDIIVLA